RPPTSKSRTSMRLKIFPWLGHEFVHLSTEGDGKGTVEEEMREVFTRFENKLREVGLTLAQTVRSRFFAKDMDAWTGGNRERGSILNGPARSVSWSDTCPERLVGDARISVDILAMYPPNDGSHKEYWEYDPMMIVLLRMNW